MWPKLLIVINSSLLEGKHLYELKEHKEESTLIVLILFSFKHFYAHTQDKVL